MGALRSCTACGEPINAAATSCWSCGAGATRAKRERRRVEVPRLPSAPAVLGIAGGATLVVGSFLPWIVIAGVFTQSGIDMTDGWVTAILGAIAAFAGYQDRKQASAGLKAALLVLGGLALLDVIYQVRQVGDTGSAAEPGIGLLLAGVGSLAVVVGGLLAHQQRR